jgi:hypothetical protein
MEAAPYLQEPAPAPYRLKGKQIADPVTVTPKQAFKPYALLSPGQLAPAAAGQTPIPEEAAQFLPLKSDPAKAQAQIFKQMGVAAPSASAKPMRSVPGPKLEPLPNQTFPGAHNGQSAALQQLTSKHYGINDLRAIAVQRGLDVSPADTHNSLIGKIMDSLTEPELKEFESQAAERSRFPLPTRLSKAAQQ